jgi:hypothetical protein
MGIDELPGPPMRKKKHQQVKTCLHSPKLNTVTPRRNAISKSPSCETAYSAFVLREILLSHLFKKYQSPSNLEIGRREENGEYTVYAESIHVRSVTAADMHANFSCLAHPSIS